MRNHHAIRRFIRIVFFVWDLELAITAGIALGMVLNVVFK
jgi:hypothetical protein